MNTEAIADQVVYMGLDTGVKGGLCAWYLDQPVLHAWNMGAVGKHEPDKLFRALERAGLITQIALKAARPDRTVIGLDTPVPVPIHPKKGGGDRTGGAYGFGLQTALWGALHARLVCAGFTVIPIRSRTARSVLGIKGTGKPPIIAWAAANKLAPFLRDRPAWEVETLSEAYMLAQAAAMQNGAS
jgi:hypothetical protein